MAGAMVQSAFTAPHVTEWVTFDATATVEFVARLKKRREFKDVKVSPLLVLCARGDARDASYAGDQLLLGRAGPGGRLQALRQPRDRGGDTAGVGRAQREGRPGPLARRAGRCLNQLTATARDGKTQPAEMSGGTFTITNVGVFGVDAGHADHQPGRVGDPVLRRDQEAALGHHGRGRRGPDRGPPRDHAGARLRPPARRRREGLARSSPTWPRSSRTRRLPCSSELWRHRGVRLPPAGRTDS